MAVALFDQGKQTSVTETFESLSVISELHNKPLFCGFVPRVTPRVRHSDSTQESSTSAGSASLETQQRHVCWMSLGLCEGMQLSQCMFSVIIDQDLIHATCSLHKENRNLL